jgi:hypothetical protein
VTLHDAFQKEEEMNKHPYWSDQDTRDKLKTLHQEAAQYRLLQNTRPQKTRGFSRFQIFQHLMAFWRTKKFRARDSKGGENV